MRENGTAATLNCADALVEAMGPPQPPRLLAPAPNSYYDELSVTSGWTPALWEKSLFYELGTLPEGFSREADTTVTTPWTANLLRPTSTSPSHRWTGNVGFGSFPSFHPRYLRFPRS